MIKKLLRSIREYKKDSIITPIFVTLEVIMEVSIPFFMAGIIDDGIRSSDMNYVQTMGIILIGAALLSLYFGVQSGRFAARASAGFARNLRKDMFYRIQEFSFSNIDKYSTASLVTRLTSDVTNVQNAYQMIIRVLIRGPLMLVFALLISMSINFRLSLIFLVALPFLGIGLFWIAIKAHPYFEQVFQTYDDLNRVVQENVSAVRVVKAYVREEHEESKFKRISKHVFQQFCSAEKIIAFNSPLMQFVMYTSILIISCMAAGLIINDTMTTGQLMSIIVYATQILSSLMMVSMVFVMVIMAQSSAKRIVEVLDEESDLKNCEHPIYEVPNGDIDFQNVDFSYQGDEEKLVIKDMNFHIGSGETIGVIGSTGSAKTTFVQLIARLYDTSGGTIKVGGIDVKDYDMDTLRNEVAMVLQKNVLFSGTIKENLRWGNEGASDDELKEACILAQADEFIQGLPDGYDTFIEQGGSNVSGGQKQRLCIARAILKQPKILILDDSTSAVDTKTDAAIREGFAHALPHTTKIIIAQRISSIESADRIIVLDKGCIIAMDTPANLSKTNSIYQEIESSQNKKEVHHE